MIYSFDAEIAAKYGIDEAIMIHNLQFWILKNRANGKHFYDGRTWTYNSVKAFAELFPFWKQGKVRQILDSLRDKGVIVTGNYNKSTYDRTMWYAFKNESEWLNTFAEMSKWICQNEQMDLQDSSNGFAEMSEPIPDSKPDKKPDSKGRRVNKFTPPLPPEVQAYLDERKVTKFTAQKFIDYYAARGWMIGKNKMKDWKAAVRTWEGNDFDNKTGPPGPQPSRYKELTTGDYEQ